MALIVELKNTLKQLKKDKRIRAVIISGNGTAFCSGLDIKSVTKNKMNLLRLLFKPFYKKSNLVQDIAYLWRKLPVPIIAVIHGKCFGGGLQIAMGADFRFSSGDCEYSIMEAKWGLIPDMAGILTWREQLRADQLKDLVFTGKIINAKEALELGLISRIEQDPMKAASNYAKQLCETSPDALASAKQLINQSYDLNTRQLLQKEASLQKKILLGKNQSIATQKALGNLSINYQDRK